MIKKISFLPLLFISTFLSNASASSVFLVCPNEESKISECQKVKISEEKIEQILNEDLDLINLDVFKNSEYSAIRVDRDGSK